jgi:hypothetical protein
MGATTFRRTVNIARTLKALTQWQVGLFMMSVSRFGGELGYAHFTATSECVGGKQGFVEGDALFAGAAEGTPINMSGSFYTLDDGIPGNTDPSVLNGFLCIKVAGELSVPDTA